MNTCALVFRSIFCCYVGSKSSDYLLSHSLVVYLPQWGREVKNKMGIVRDDKEIHQEN